MTDTIVCSECSATVEGSNKSAHDTWHRELKQRIDKAVKDGIAAFEQRMARTARQRSLGGR